MNSQKIPHIFRSQLSNRTFFFERILEKKNLCFYRTIFYTTICPKNYVYSLSLVKFCCDKKMSNCFQFKMICEDSTLPHMALMTATKLPCSHLQQNEQYLNNFCLAEFVTENKDILSFSIISQHWDCTGGWNPYLWMTNYISNIMAGWETKFLEHSPENRWRFYALYKIPIAQANLLLPQLKMHTH